MKQARHRLIKVFCDGGARGNPGPAASGVVILTADNKIIEQFNDYWGIATNNFAEYKAVEIGLRRLKQYKFDSAEFYLDSELVVKQLNRLYKVKNPVLKLIYFDILTLVDDLAVTFHHIPRSQNKLADKQVNLCLDYAQGIDIAQQK